MFGQFEFSQCLNLFSYFCPPFKKYLCDIKTLVTLALFSRHTFEFAHVGGTDGCSNYCKVINLGNVVVSLVVPEKELQVLDILKLDKLEANRRSVQLFLCQPVNAKPEVLQ